ncbi:MAG: Holliday junction ATP-dependent DNA helicase RuvA [candidate division TM6 bacterium GW2011_GWF2_37_49]|nr:MAG: Holliday junction ATP-dependent DNA helicase RuvA [candidate division TM6 bacterium GW2011_GWF2_37_49]
MIDLLSGKVKNVGEKSITLFVGGIGFLLNVPRTSEISQDSVVDLFTYLHWNPENGPSLYGFKTELERQVFLMIIDCPKIGPSIASNILSQISATDFLKVVNAQDEKALSSVNGIGSKKAEQIIVALKHKVSKMVVAGVLAEESQSSFVQWQNVNDVMASLGYTKPEIHKTVQHLSQKYNGENIALDQLIRAALTFISSNRGG